VLVFGFFLFFPFFVELWIWHVSIAPCFVLVLLFRMRNCGFSFSDLSNEIMNLGLLMFEFGTLNSELLSFSCLYYEHLGTSFTRLGSNCPGYAPGQI